MSHRRRENSNRDRLLTLADSGAWHQKVAATGASVMRFVDRYPIIVTAAHKACREFWVRHLGLEVVFENEWVAYLAGGGATIAFMSPAHPSSPPGAEPYEAGISFELEVEDSAAAL